MAGNLTLHLNEGSILPLVLEKITFVLIITLLDHIFVQQATDKYPQLCEKPQHRLYYVEMGLQELIRKKITSEPQQHFSTERVLIK